MPVTKNFGSLGGSRNNLYRSVESEDSEMSSLVDESSNDNEEDRI